MDEETRNVSWREFVEFINSRLSELGMSQDVEIEYIDFGWAMKDSFKRDIDVYPNDNKSSIVIH